MQQLKSDIADDRSLTDACLDAERVAGSDADGAIATSAARQILDDLIERDRRLADARLLKFRVQVDRTLSRERSAAPSADLCVAHERDSAEQCKLIERKVTDALLQQERQKSDAAVEARREDHDEVLDGLESKRQKTDDQLSIERQGADAIGNALGETKSILGDARNSLTQAQTKEQRQHNVLDMVAHDLRSPLGTIYLSADCIASTTTDESIRSAARLIERAAARMERLVSDLVDVACIESGALRISRQSQDVSALLKEVLDSYESMFSARDITFCVDTKSDGVEACFDHDRIVQVLSNLLGNAMKFTQAGGTVGLRIERQAAMVVFVVSDDGAGIARAALPHIFERFWSVDSNARRGLGLGLYICESIIHAHGGKIEATSEPGKGATFRFSLPMAA
jgi:signal transduction histidine kinase